MSTGSSRRRGILGWFFVVVLWAIQFAALAWLIRYQWRLGSPGPEPHFAELGNVVIFGVWAVATLLTYTFVYLTGPRDR